jgi:hypothetical protein
MVKLGSDVMAATPTAFVLAAALNYWLSIWILFRHKARWTSLGEISIFAAVVLCIGGIDLAATQFLINLHFPPWLSKSIATALGLTLNFAGRRFLAFPEPGNPDWAPQKNLS